MYVLGKHPSSLYRKTNKQMYVVLYLQGGPEINTLKDFGILVLLHFGEIGLRRTGLL